MKKPKLTALLITMLLAAGTVVQAQVAPPSPASAAGKSYGDGSYVLPKTSAPNLYLEGGLVYTRYDAGDAGTENFYGVNAAFGWRINKNNKIQVELGVLASSGDEYSEYVPDVGQARISFDYATVPLLASYSYCIPLDANGRWDLRITPTVGLYTMKMESEAKAGGVKISSDDTDSAIAYGVGIGTSYHINNRFYLDFGYRFMRVGSLTCKLWGESLELDDANTHSITASFGWKF
ncbi:porin family protein [Termitidicoccus mucosus]